MIPNYIKPQLTIEQLLAVLPDASTSRLSSVVIGPQYLLSRYGKEDLVPNAAFDAAGQVFTYQYYDASDVLQDLGATYVVDTGSVKLNGVGLEAELANFTQAGGAFTIESTSASNIIKLGTNYVKGSGTLNTLFRTRPVAVGDVVYTSETDDTVDATTKRRVVVGFKGVDVAATVGDATNSPYNPVTDGVADATTTVSAPTGWTISTTGTLNVNVRGGSVLASKLGEEFTLTVSDEGTPGSETDTAEVNITSKSGDFSVNGVVSVDDAGDYTFTDSELAGLTVKLAHASATLVAGQVFIFRAYQAYERLVDTDNVTVTGTYTGTKDTTYIIKVTTGVAAGDTATGAVLSITDTAGIDDPQTISPTEDTNFALGSFGLSCKFALGSNTVVQAGLRAGDVFSVVCTAAAQSSVNFDRVILSGPAVDTTTFVNAATPIRVQFRLAYTGPVLSTDASDGTAWTATSTEVTTDAGMALYVDARSTSYKWTSFADGVGKLYLSYRALVPAPASEDKISIETVSDITDSLGTIDMDNELAFGANEMLSGSQGKRIFALRTAGTTTTNFTNALRKLESTDGVYALCPLTTSLEVQQAVASHCDSMSVKTKKNFRRCYVGTDSPGSYAVLTIKSDLTNYTATIGDYGGYNVLLTTTDDVDFETLGLESGDLVKLTASDDEYEISSILSSTEIILVTGPDAPVAPAVPFQLWRANTASSQVDYIQQRSIAIGSRRAVNVWVENGTRLLNGTSTVIPNRFVACEIAGLRCSVLPQQGLTYTEIKSVTDAASMYVKYNDDNLDAVAASGTFIITQEAESGAIYIRHQLTTKSSGGSLYYEDSVGVNLDNISFKVKDRMQGYIGKKNVTSKTLLEIQKDVVTILDEETTVPPNATYGPSLNGYQDLAITVHPTLKDRISIYAKLLMPLPLNNIDVVLEADVDLSL